VEVALKAGCPSAMLVQRGSDVDWQSLHGAARLGVTAGASAPEILVEEVIEACRERFEVTIEEVTVTSEDVQFKLPRELAHAATPA
jgi:4-hydroxy-3-methylbut-2-enyl diphosphate reductase